MRMSPFLKPTWNTPFHFPQPLTLSSPFPAITHLLYRMIFLTALPLFWIMISGNGRQVLGTQGPWPLSRLEVGPCTPWHVVGDGSWRG